MLPNLPLHPHNASWSPDVYMAYQKISEMYDQAAQVLSQEAKPSRLRSHAERITLDAVPILLAMEEHLAEEHIPLPWLHSLTESVGLLIRQLCDAHESVTHWRVH